MLTTSQLLQYPELIRSFRAVFFDLDGTLFNSEPLHAEALVQAAKQFDIDLTGIDPLHDFLGMPDPAVFRFFQTNGLAAEDITQESFIAAKNSHYLAHCRDLNPHQWVELITPGAFDFLISLKKLGILTAVVTASEPEIAETMLQTSELRPLFDHITARGVCFRSKPSAGPYLHTLRHWQLRGHETLVFEDSPTGQESALLSGCHVIAIEAFTSQEDSKLDRIDNFFGLINKN